MTPNTKELSELSGLAGQDRCGGDPGRPAAGRGSGPGGPAGDPQREGHGPVRPGCHPPGALVHSHRGPGSLRRQRRGGYRHRRLQRRGGRGWRTGRTRPCWPTPPPAWWWARWAPPPPPRPRSWPTTRTRKQIEPRRNAQWPHAPSDGCQPGHGSAGGRLGGAGVCAQRGTPAWISSAVRWRG